MSRDLLLLITGFVWAASVDALLEGFRRGEIVGGFVLAMPSAALAFYCWRKAQAKI
jgi:hypothetical protein